MVGPGTVVEMVVGVTVMVAKELVTIVEVALKVFMSVVPFPVMVSVTGEAVV